MAFALPLPEGDPFERLVKIFRIIRRADFTRHIDEAFEAFRVSKFGFGLRG